MKFTPKSDGQLEQEAAARGPFKAGEYDFDVIEATDDVSKNGNDMIALKIKVYNDLGETRTVRDWLVSTDGMMYKIKHFADSTGLTKEYESGGFESFDCLNRSGKVKLRIEKGSGSYPDKNTVADYVPASHERPKMQAPKPSSTADLDDEIPF